MTEKDMQTFWGKFIEKNPPEDSEIWELKFTKTSSIRFDAVQPHQRKALLQAKNKGIYHKITDPPVFYGQKTRFNVKRPFDCLYLKGIKSYVLVWFYKPRKPKEFIKIDIDTYLAKEMNSSKKSFNEKEALDMGTVIKLY